LIIDNALAALDAHLSGVEFVIYNGSCVDLINSMPDEIVNLILTSPPYFMGKNYDRSYNIEDFYSDHKLLAPSVERITRSGGNVCWQVGYHVQNGALFPLDFAIFEVFRGQKHLVLRNRIVWHFGHGTHARKRFSGRHETLLWFGKGVDSYCDMDAVRVPQKYPGKRHYKGPNKGELSGNPSGKNPSDVWNIPNVNANHVEKTEHPCQFPVALAQRVVRALCKAQGAVFDPFAGSGTTGIAACMEGRSFLGAEISENFCHVAEARYQALKTGDLRHRPIERDIWAPSPNAAVARRPDHFSASLAGVVHAEKSGE
jgi:adenine-specific DNA-methyltransferase